MTPNDPETPAATAVEAARTTAMRLRQAGHEAFLVGGCVRDALLGLEPKDADVATSALPGEVEALFPHTRFVGARFGVCLVPGTGRWIEVATFRRDGVYEDRRRPASVRFGTLEEDARRRDFTVNALYQDPSTGGVVDLVGGCADLEGRVLRCVGDPRRRFDEDALRLLRAVRFASRLGFTIEPQTWQSMVALAPTLAAVSGERQRDELTAMLVHPAASRALRLLDQSGLLSVCLPEVAALKGVDQDPVHHPEGDVWTHTLLCLDNLDLRVPTAVWGTLLHDIGKPATCERQADGRIRFLGHEGVGADIARRVCRRLRFSAADTARICALVSRHMRFIQAHEWRASTMRRFIAADTILEDLALHRADALSSNGNLRGWQTVRDAIAAREASGASALPPPFLTGDDLRRMGYRPGPVFKEILDAVQVAQLDGILATSDEARAFVTARWPLSG
jgi:poly(A) polymerase